MRRPPPHIVISLFIAVIVGLIAGAGWYKDRKTLLATLHSLERKYDLNQAELLRIKVGSPTTDRIEKPIIESINEGLYWILLSGAPHQEDYNAIVDTRSGNVMPLKVRDRMFVDVKRSAISDSLFEIQWDGYGPYHYIDYFDRHSGELIVSLGWDHGQVITIDNVGTHLALALETDCREEFFDQPGQIETIATGLKVNGSVIPFVQPQKVICGTNDNEGGVEVDPFGKPVLDPDKKVISFTLPWKTVVTIDSNNLSVEGIKIIE